MEGQKEGAPREERRGGSEFQTKQDRIRELEDKGETGVSPQERNELRRLRKERAKLGQEARAKGLFHYADKKLAEIFDESEKKEDRAGFVFEQLGESSRIEESTYKLPLFARAGKELQRKYGDLIKYYTERALNRMWVEFSEEDIADNPDIGEMREYLNKAKREFAAENWEWRVPEGRGGAGEEQREEGGGPSIEEEAPEEPLAGRSERAPGVELPRTPEQAIKLVRQQLLEWMENVTQHVYTEDWLDGKWIRGIRGLTLGGILKELEGRMSGIDRLKDEIKAVQALHKRYTLLQLNRFSVDGISTMTQEAEKIGAVLAVTERPEGPVRHLETIANLLPEREGGVPVGDIVSRLFIDYRAMALSDKSPKNLFKLSPKEASDEKVKEIRESVREAVGKEDKNSLTCLYADEIALRLVKFLGEVAWGDTDANGPVAGLDALSYLMHFGKYRERQTEDNKPAGPLNTIKKGCYPPHLLTPFTRMFQVETPAGVKKFLWELLDEGKLLRELPLGQMRGADGYFLFRVGQAARLAARLLDTEGKDADLKGLAELNGIVKVVLSKDVIQVMLDSKKGAEGWGKDEDRIDTETKKWARRIKYNYINGLHWVLAYPRGTMSQPDFLHKVIHPAIAAGVITQDDADEISGYDWIGTGWVKLKTLLGIRRKP